MRWYVISLAVLAALLLASGCFATTYGQHYGVVDQWGTDGSGTDPMSVIFTNLGAKWIRSGWDWDLIEGLGDDQYDPVYLGLMDNWANTMQALGINIYYGFSYTPAWARPGGTGNNTPPTDPTRYTDFITFMVNRYKDRIKHWGLWNEPNLDGFWNGTDDSYIHNILIPGIAAIKAADPTAKVVVGELASCCNESSLLQAFLTEITAHGKKDLVDVISVHGYGYGDTASGRIAHLDSLRSMIVSAGYGEKDFWCTETSWDGRGTTSGENTQASQIVAFMQGMDSRPWWKKTFYFTLSEGGGATQGLIRSDHSLKPAYTQYQAYIAEHADDAEMASDTIPTTMVTGRQYYASVTVRNTGTTTWQQSLEHKLGAVDDSDPFAAGRVDLGPSDSVPSDTTKTFWFSMTAPTATGTYTTDWRMVREFVHWFGHPLVKQVVVNNGPDTTAPGPVTAFSAVPGDGQITLSWTNPLDADFSKAMIRFKTTGYPTSATDGTLVVDKSGLPGTGDSYVHTGRTNGTTYYYAAFAHDVVPNYSASAVASAAPSDMTPPFPVTSFAAVGGNSQVTLSWHNPSDSDFHSTAIYYRTDTYPAFPADGALVVSKAGPPGGDDSHTPTGLTNWQTYYYTAFARDGVPNYSSGVNASARPRGQVRFQDEFAYANGSLNGNGGWYGSATTQIVVEDQTVKVVGGAGSNDAIQDFIPSCDGNGTVAAVEIRARRGSGAYSIWNLWIDDPNGNNFGRWYSTGSAVRGRIGASGPMSGSRSLTGDWDILYVKVDFAADTTEFIVNGTSLGSYSHASTGAGDEIARLRLERINTASATGNYVHLDHFVLGAPDSAPPSAAVSGPSLPITRMGPVSYNVSFSEPVFNFDASADVQVNSTGGASAGTVLVTGSGSGPYTVTLSDLSGDGTLGITVKSGVANDAAGNGNTASAASATFRVLGSDGRVSNAKAQADSAPVGLANKALYLKQAGFGYVEELDRTSGIRVEGILSGNVGDLVCISGTMATKPGGERYVLVDAMAPCGTGSIDPLGLNNRAFVEGLVCGLYVKVWGKVKPGSITGTSYVLTDGSDDVGIRVITSGPPGVTENQFVTVTGAAGLEGVYQ